MNIDRVPGGSDEICNAEYSRMKFPSDGLTIRDIRVHEPQRIDTTFPHLSTDDTHSIENLLMLERCVAKFAFVVAFGQGNKYRELAREGGYKEFEEELVDEYMFYGLAKTTHEANELIRNIKEQARSQARESLGLDPEGGRTGRG